MKESTVSSNWTDTCPDSSDSDCKVFMQMCKTLTCSQVRFKLCFLNSNFSEIQTNQNQSIQISGGVSEFPLRDGHVGPTFACIIGRQFSDLKFGDRFYFEHGNQAGSFSPGTLTLLECAH